MIESIRTAWSITGNPLEAEATRGRTRQPRLHLVQPLVASETKIFFNERSRTETEWRTPQSNPCLFALIIKSSSTMKTLICHWGKCTDKVFHPHCVQTGRALALPHFDLPTATGSGWGNKRGSLRLFSSISFGLGCCPH